MKNIINPQSSKRKKKLTFFIICVTVCQFCLSNGTKISFHISDEKYFILYQRNISLPQEASDQVISIETNFPNEVSLIISTGIFGKIKVLPMECQKQKNFTCSAKLTKQSLEKENYFWFILKTKQGYYHVPNMLITKDKLFEKIGRIEVK